MTTVTEQLDLIFHAKTDEAKKSVEDYKKSIEGVEGANRDLAEAADEASESTEKYTDAASNASGENGNLSDSISSVISKYGLKIASLVAVVGAIKGVIRVSKELIDTYAVQAEAEIKLDSMLRISDSNIRMTTEDLEEYASQLQRVTRFGDEAYLDAMRYFVKIDGLEQDIFKRASADIADIAEGMGTSLAGAAQTLAFALEDPAEGLSRLRREGIIFTDAEQDMIKSLVEAGNKSEAQAVILDKLEKKYGGLAESIANTPVGKLTQISNVWGDIKEGLGGVLLDTISPALDTLYNTLVKISDWVNDVRDLNGISAALQRGDDISGYSTSMLQKALAEYKGIVDNPPSAGIMMRVDTYIKWVKIIEEELEERSSAALQTGLENGASGAAKTLSEKMAGFMGNNFSLPLSQQYQAVIDEAEAYLAEMEKHMSSVQGDTPVFNRTIKDLGFANANEAEEAWKKLNAIIADNKKKLEDLNPAEDALVSYTEQYNNQLAEIEANLARVNAELEEAEDPALIAYLENVRKKLEESKNSLGGKTIWETVLGTDDVDNWILNVPIEFSLEDKTELDEAQEKLKALKSAYEKLYDPSNGSAEYVENMAKIKKAYDDQLAVVTKLTRYEEERLKAANYLATLQTEEQARMDNLYGLAVDMAHLYSDGFLTYEEAILVVAKEIRDEAELNAFWEQYKLDYSELYFDILEKIRAKSAEINNTTKNLSAMWENVKQKCFSVDSIAGALTNTFSKMGAAIAEGDSAWEGMAEGISEYLADITGTIATSAIAAGLRIIAEQGTAGLPVGLALLAIGGASAFASGFLGASGQGLDDSLMKAMEDEVNARQKLADTINESIDEEYYLLKRQLERNRISVESFRSEAGDLNEQRNLADATLAAVKAAQAEVSSINSDLQDMSSWDKFWTNKDEKMETRAKNIKNLIQGMSGNISREELLEILEKLVEYGVDTSAIPAFANGGTFLTNGPQLVLVGDNPSGREIVNIEPIGSGQVVGSSQNITINIQTAYGIEDLYGQLSDVGRKIGRRALA